VEVKEINLDDLAMMASEADGSGTARKLEEEKIVNGKEGM
jgi:hypothetical protein